MNVRHIDLTGRRIGTRVVIERAGRNPSGNALWRVVCDCGREGVVRGDALTRGDSMRCGSCNAKTPKKHGMCNTYEYACWRAMKDRCYRKAHVAYERYSRLGVCDRWNQSFEDFFNDMGPAPSEDHTLDRIDNSKGYEPGNVRWATRKEQGNNRTNNRRVTINGVTKNMCEWADSVGMKRTTFKERLCRGWEPERALTEPVNGVPR